jgi:hypothetical protein
MQPAMTGSVFTNKMPVLQPLDSQTLPPTINRRNGASNSRTLLLYKFVLLHSAIFEGEILIFI